MNDGNLSGKPVGDGALYPENRVQPGAAIVQKSHAVGVAFVQINAALLYGLGLGGVLHGRTYQARACFQNPRAAVSICCNAKPNESGPRWAAAVVRLVMRNMIARASVLPVCQ